MTVLRSLAGSFSLEEVVLQSPSLSFTKSWKEVRKPTLGAAKSAGKEILPGCRCLLVGKVKTETRRHHNPDFMFGTSLPSLPL